MDVDDDIARLLMGTFGEMGAAVALAAANRAHPLARSNADLRILGALVRQPINDKRQGLLRALGSLQVPAMGGGDIKSLVKIRQSDEQFAEWRDHLARALSNIDGLPDTEESATEATSIVASELADGLTSIVKATKKSPAVKAIKGGLTGFGITGVSAAASGIITGNPFVALATGAAGKTAETVVAYLKALQERRKNRLILDVAMSFIEANDRT